MRRVGRSPGVVKFVNWEAIDTSVKKATAALAWPNAHVALERLVLPGFRGRHRIAVAVTQQPLRVP